MSGLVPQGTRSWGNGVRAEGAGAALEGLRRSVEGMNEGYGNRVGRGLALKYLPLWGPPSFPCIPALTPKITVVPGFWPSVLCLTHFVPLPQPTTFCLPVSYLTCSFSTRLGNVHSLTLLPPQWESTFLAKLQPFKNWSFPHPSHNKGFVICLKKKVKVLVTQSCPTLSSPWTVQGPLELSRQRILDWVAVPFPPGDLPDP